MTHDETPQPERVADLDAGARPEVVAWGSDEPEPTSRPARGLARLRLDPRLAPTVAGLSAVALLFSLVSEWRVWTRAPAGADPSQPGEAVQITSGVLAFPATGGAYVVGLLALASCFALAYRGSAAVRGNARLLGLAVTGALGGLLAAAVAAVEELGGTYDDLIFSTSSTSGETVTVGLGRGVFLAFVGVAGAALACYLLPAGKAGRSHATAPRLADMPAGDGTVAGGGPLGARTDGWDPDADDTEWPWRSAKPRRQARVDQPPAAGPPDLTVRPAEPFLPPTDPRHGR